MPSLMASAAIKFPAQCRLLVLDDVDSTNAEALRLAVAGESGPLWIMARRQSAGRGRMGRRWLSCEGNLHASLLLTLPCRPALAPQLSLLAGLAVYDSIVRLANLSGQGGRLAAGAQGLRLKWPNDCLIGDQKICGILGESMSTRGMTTGSLPSEAASLVTVTGVGINLAQPPQISDRPVTSLQDHGINADPETALAVLAGEFCRWLEIWQQGRNFSSVVAAWEPRTFALGERICININVPPHGTERSGSASETVTGTVTRTEARLGVVANAEISGRERHPREAHAREAHAREVQAREVCGRYAGLDPSGALLIETADGGLQCFTFGDVSLPSRPG